MRSALFVMPILLIGLAAFALWVWTLIDVLKVPTDDRFRTGTQLVWVLVIVFTQIVGSVLYLVIGRPEPALRR